MVAAQKGRTLMQPVIIEGETSIGAGVNIPNILALTANAASRPYIRSPFAARGKLIAVQSALGLLIDMDYGSKNVVTQSVCRVAATMQDPYDVINENWYPNEGDQLALRVANPTAGALTLRWRIVLFPVDQLLPDSRVYQSQASIAAGTVSQQLLDGTRYERPPAPSYLTVFMSASATGLLRQLQIDTDLISPPAAVNPTNQIPQDPLDTTIEGVEVEEDKLQSLSVSNPTGGALTVFFKQVLTELVRT